MKLTAWQKGDVIKLNGEQFRLISDAYSREDGIVVCDTDRSKGDTISYLTLIEEAYLVENIYGRKN